MPRSLKRDTAISAAFGTGMGPHDGSVRTHRPVDVGRLAFVEPPHDLVPGLLLLVHIQHHRVKKAMRRQAKMILLAAFAMGVFFAHRLVVGSFF